ncbi:MAG: DUF2298 domain-containing protein [Ardenticatenia bacterium]|nr:DUF2298 domain-containing protein [Ardenticatenia bacterium]
MGTSHRRRWAGWVDRALTSQAMVPFWLGLILLVGGVLRFTGLNWDQGQHLHPDERFLTMVETALRWPSSVGEYLDEARSPLNPRNVGYSFFVYGTLPTTIVRGVAEVLERTGYDQVHLVGRAVSATFDLASVFVLFLLGRTLYRDTRVALMAAFLLATTVLAIQHAHFFVVDTFANFFIVTALYWLARAQRSGRAWDFAMTGLFFGLAMASKISIFTFALVVTLVGAYRVWDEWTSHHSADRLRLVAEQTFVRLVLTALVAFVTFRLAQPDAFQGLVEPSQRWLQNITAARDLVSGNVDYPPGHQWTNRPPLWFPWKNMVLWGMGLPLGLAAWAGWAVAAWRLRRHQEWAHLIPVSWVAVLFLHQGTQWVKSLRYFLPIYPTLALLAAWLLVWLWDRARHDDVVTPRRPALMAWTPAKAGGLAAVVLVGTTLWALAFTSIYTRPHSRVQASRWIYANIPPGSTIANEHWDDPLPLRIDGKDPFGGLYRGIEMQWYNEDTPEKLQQALDWLDQADYIILSSNRLYDSIPRLPMRYPMTVKYYEALFSGELGFEKVAEFTSYPQLFGIEIPDQSAEEAFSVYDHPRVQIFKKTPAYSRERATRILGNVDWDGIVRLWPKQATKAPTALMLPGELWTFYRQQGTWSAMFNRDGLANRVSVLVWALALFLLGLISWPYVFAALPALPDRGYALAKPLGLLLVSWAVWWAASLRLMTFTRGAILAAAVALATGSGLLFWRQRTAWRAFWRTRRTLIVLEEGLFWAFFALVLGVRWANPDLWHPVLGGEKPMDFAYLNAIIKSAYFPPYDPWFAGGYINYYYFGFVLTATLIKLTGVVPYVAYNLAVPTFFAMTAMSAFGATLVLQAAVRRPHRQWTGARQVAVALLGAIFVAIIGNLGELQLLLNGFAEMSTLEVESRIPGLALLVRAIHGFLTGFLAGEPLNFRIEWWYWNATRVISHPPSEAGPITEFPWFTFLYADLHAHMMALPFTLVMIVLSAAFLVRHGKSRRSLIGHGLLTALVLGMLWPTNTWDFPTYALILLAALTLREWDRRGAFTPDLLWGSGWRWGVMVALSYTLYRPFHAWYGSAYGSVERWRGSQTPLQDYLIIHGFFLFVIIAALLVDLRFGRGHNGVVRLLRLSLRFRRRMGRLLQLHRALVRPGLMYGMGLYALGVVFLVGGVLLIVGRGVPAVGLWLLALVIALGWRRRPDPLWQMVLVMVAVGVGLTLVVEFLVLKGDISRMNTVFKFYLQVWVLFAVASAVGVARIWRTRPRWPSGWRALWTWGFVALFGATLLYPVLATRAKINDRFDTSVGPTLNGMAFMDKAIHYDRERALPLVWDKQAIEWLQENVQGSPVIAEINTYPTLYGWGNRYAMFTGLPAIVGWDWHQRQQRALLPGEVVTRRIEDVQRLYTTPDPNEAYQILRHYEAEYIIVGELERAYATPEGIAKFAQMDGLLWDLVYANEGTHIYRVRSP